MASLSNNEPNPNRRMTRRHRLRAERHKSSTPEITGRIRTRPKPKDVPNVSDKSVEPQTIRRASLEERQKRPRGEPREGREYQPLVYAKNGMRIEDLEHDIGYGKAPEKGKFKPGQSGNPKGRPKGSKGTSTILNETLGKWIISRANGKEQKITTREGIIIRLVKKALDGDHNAIKMIMSMDEGFELLALNEQRRHDNEENSAEIDEEIIAEFERQVLEKAQLSAEASTEKQHAEKEDDDS